jgi:hypothetical protein
VADNQVIGARRAISLTAAPSAALLTLTADDFFTAYVNGQEVGHSSPQPSDNLVWQHAKTYDVAKLLHPGPNVIAVRGQNVGSAAGIIGMLRYTVAGKASVIVTDASWQVSETTPDGWQQPSFSDSAWKPANVEAGLSGGIWAGSLDGWPGLTGPDYLKRLDLPVVKVVSAEPRLGKISDADSVVGTKPAHLVMTPPPAGTPEEKSPAVMVDFGQETSGRVEVTNASTAPIQITLRYGESEDEALLGPYTHVQSLTIPAGQVGACIDSAFRYAIVTLISGPDDGARISHITLNMDYYPVQYLGSFESSDPLLNRIWYVGAYTAHLCMQQDIWDAPKRDRARWMGDLQVSGEVINNVFLDKFLMEQTMDRLRAEAGTPPHGHVNGIPGYSCAWVVAMADFYRHTGDLAYLQKHHADLVTMMDFFKTELDDHGVFANKHGQWAFADWSPGFNGQAPHSLWATQFYMIDMLRQGAWMLDQLGDPSADTYRQWADQAIQAAHQYIMDPATHTFGDRWQDNAMAIYSGAASPADMTAIWDKVLSHPYPVDLMITPYYNNYDIFAMALSGHTQDALSFVRNYWGGMINEGATTFWEGYDPRWPKEHFHKYLQADNGMGYFVSLCHGWSAGATDLLTEYILGVRSTGPGFQTVDIEPQLCDLTWAAGTVPTPRGLISVRFERKGNTLVTDAELPPDTRANFIFHGVTHWQKQGQKLHAVTQLAKD